jgi:hypothetical protein
MRDRSGPATPKQREYAVALGINVRDDMTFGEVSDKINEALQTRLPSPSQIEFAHNLGIEFDEATVTYTELHDLLNIEIAKRSKAAMRDNADLRAGKTIMYKDKPYEIVFIGGRRKRWVADLKPCYKGLGRRVTVMIITIQDARHVNVLPDQRQA